MKNKAFVISCCLIIQLAVFGQQAQGQEEEAIAMVTQIYSEVSGTSEESVDWDKIRSFFVEEAVIVLRTSREATSLFTVEEFIQDFKTFYQSPRLGESGFKEEVLKLEAEVFHDIAFVAVVYSASILDSESPASKGIDFWSLIRKEDQWKVVSVTNEVVRPDGKLPAIFD